MRKSSSRIIGDDRVHLSDPITIKPNSKIVTFISDVRMKEILSRYNGKIVKTYPIFFDDEMDQPWEIPDMSLMRLCKICRSKDRFMYQSRRLSTNIPDDIVCSKIRKVTFDIPNTVLIDDKKEALVYPVLPRYANRMIDRFYYAIHFPNPIGTNCDRMRYLSDKIVTANDFHDSPDTKMCIRDSQHVYYITGWPVETTCENVYTALRESKLVEVIAVKRPSACKFRNTTDDDNAFTPGEFYVRFDGSVFPPPIRKLSGKLTYVDGQLTIVKNNNSKALRIKIIDTRTMYSNRIVKKHIDDDIAQ